MRLTRSEQQARTRALLLLAAREEFEARGFSAATLEQICDRAGFSRTAVYKHFAGKNEILLAVAEQEAAEQAAVGQQVLADEGRSPIEALVEWFGLTGERGRRLVRAKAEFVLGLGDDEVLRGRIADLQRDVETQATQMVAEIITRAGVSSRISDAELAVLVVAVANGLWQRGLVFPAFDADGAFRAAITTLVQGAGTPLPAQEKLDRGDTRLSTPSH